MIRHNSRVLVAIKDGIAHVTQVVASETKRDLEKQGFVVYESHVDNHPREWCREHASKSD